MQRARSLKDLIRQPFGAYHNLTVLISLHEKNTPALAICQARVFETGNSRFLRDTLFGSVAQVVRAHA